MKDEGFGNEGEVKFHQVKKRAVRGVAALTTRTFLLQIVAFFGFFFLTVFLGQEEIGLFFAVSEIVAILGYFSDIGLAAALIQKKGRANKEDIQSTFTIQETIVLTLIVTTLLLTPLIRRYYDISASGLWLLYALLAGFFLASLKTIPSVLLERKLRFDLLVVVELAETLIFYGLAVFLAWQGWGVIAYAWAVFFRGVVGAVLINLVSPWRVGLAFRTKVLRRLLRFGVPYQANTILAVVKDRLMNIFLWKIIGAGGVGILGWAQKWAQMPLRFVMDPVMKVTFPAFSRLQQVRGRLKKAVEFSLFSVSALIFPLLTGIGLLANALIRVLPQYEKWEVALVPLYLFLFNAAWGGITTPLTNAYNAVGKIKVTFRLMILWTILTWVITPILALNYGWAGAAWALGLIPVSSLVVFWLVKKDFGIRVGPAIGKPLVASIFLAGYLWVFQKYYPVVSVFCLVISALTGGAIYALVLFMIARAEVDRGWELVKNAFSR